MLIRFATLLILSLVPHLALAQNQFISFEWQKNSRFEFQFYYFGTPTAIKGELLENSTVRVEDQGYILDLKAFSDGVVYAVVNEAGEGRGHLYLLESQGSFYTAMRPDPIQALYATVFADLESVIGKVGSASLAFRLMVDYFGDNPESLLGTYEADLTAGRVSMALKPRIGPDATAGGVVQMPDGVAKPKPMDIKEQVVVPIPRPRPKREGDPVVVPVPQAPVEPTPAPLDLMLPDQQTRPRESRPLEDYFFTDDYEDYEEPYVYVEPQPQPQPQPQTRRKRRTLMDLLFGEPEENPRPRRGGGSGRLPIFDF